MPLTDKQRLQQIIDSLPDDVIIEVAVMAYDECDRSWIEYVSLQDEDATLYECAVGKLYFGG